jgi:hypothetical protein
MRRLLNNRPSPAMVVALIALFVALGGSGYAAVQLNGKVLKNGSVAGKKLKRNSVTGKQIKESALATVPRARSLGGKTADDFLPLKGTAVNSQKLGGLSRTSFVRRECDVDTGQVKGIVTIAAATNFPGTFTTVSGYSCNGQTIEARKLGMGRYEVRFNGSPATEWVATARVSGVEAFEASVLPEGPGLVQVNTVQPNTPPNGAFADVPFTLVAL